MELTLTGKRRRYPALDIAKFLCALMILFYHYFSEHGPVPGIIEEALSLYAVAVALFMCISGFLIFDKLEGVTGTVNRWNCVKKQVKRILTIYLLWSIPYLIYSVSEWNHISFSFVAWQVQGWIFRSTFYTIWFMPVLAVGLVLTFWLNEKLPKQITLVLAILMYITGALMTTYSWLGNMTPGFEPVAIFASTWLGGGRGWLFFAFPLIMLGKLMVRMKKKIKMIPMLILAFLFMFCMLIEALVLRHFVGHTGIDMAIFMIPTVFCVLGFLITLELPDCEITVWMRKMSTLIFMSQRIFLTVLPAILPNGLVALVFLNNWIGAVIVCGMTLLFSNFIMQLSKKYKVFEYLY